MVNTRTVLEIVGNKSTASSSTALPFSGMVPRRRAVMHKADGPEIIAVHQILVWHIEVAVLTPVGSPGVANDEYFFLFDVANRHDRMGMGTILLIPGRRRFCVAVRQD